MKSKYASAIALSLALSAASAFAADLPSRKAPAYLPPPPPPPLWTGFYVGLNAGGTWAESNSITTSGSPLYFDPTAQFLTTGAIATSNALAVAASSNFRNREGGFIGGGQIGYNYQFNNSFVVGIEADIQGVAGSNSTQWSPAFTSFPFFPTDYYVSGSSAHRSLDYLGTVRGRLGFLVTPTLLVYGTGGLAYGGVNLNTSFAAKEVSAFFPPVASGTSFSDTRAGWTAGGGVEWLFLPNWSAKLEYLYYDLGSVTTNGSVTQINTLGRVQPWGAAATQTSTRFDGHIVRVGVNYHFNWGAPAAAVAKY